MSHANAAATPPNTPLKRYHLVMFQAHDSISYDTFRSVRKALDSKQSHFSEIFGLMRGVVRSPLGNNSERDTRLRAAWSSQPESACCSEWCP